MVALDSLARYTRYQRSSIREVSTGYGKHALGQYWIWRREVAGCTKGGCVHGRGTRGTVVTGVLQSCA
eukprot:2725351-Rhodomonas_salina.3